MPESDSTAEAERRRRKKKTAAAAAAAAAEAEMQIYRCGTRSRSNGGARRVAPATITVEKHLCNGDLYAGGFVGNLPEGQGKYLWSDGCMYEGEWRRGRASGIGKFSWPTGATYEGEFRRGRIEGAGTFTAADGGTYGGAWRQDAREGYGRKCYSNGDVYEGWWRRDLHDGDGRYTWSNGDHYAGEWSSGEISGGGAFVSYAGGRYEGRWENGTPVAFGDGLHRFTSSPENIFAAVRRRFPIRGARSPEARPSPRTCVWEDCDGASGGGEREAAELRRDAAAAAVVGGLEERRQGTGARVSCEGEMIEVGHRSYDLVQSVQLGIRYSVGNLKGGREVRSGDFDGRGSRWRRFPREGARNTPPHQSPEFRWKDYCPVVFRRLREEFEVDPAEYMMSICGDDPLRGLSSPGKSGSSFYLTQDERFMIKTVKKSEVKVLLKMLRGYYNHVCEYNTSLLAKFFGLHCVKPVGGPKTRFVVMGNFLFSEYQIHRRFDLKGSSHGRRTERPGRDFDCMTTLKDLDLNFAFRLHPDRFYQLKRQIDIDCEFLEAEGIMDYSLLVGLHFRDAEMGDPFGSLTGIENVFQSRMLVRDRPFPEKDPPHSTCLSPLRKYEKCVGLRMEARAERRPGKNEVGTRYGVDRTRQQHDGAEMRDSILHLGIIDILQDYHIGKRLEHVYKSLQVDPASISAVDPKYYSKRIREFIGRIFVQEC